MEEGPNGIEMKGGGGGEGGGGSGKRVEECYLDLKTLLHKEQARVYRGLTLAKAAIALTSVDSR